MALRGLAFLNTGLTQRFTSVLVETNIDPRFRVPLLNIFRIYRS